MKAVEKAVEKAVGEAVEKAVEKIVGRTTTIKPLKSIRIMIIQISISFFNLPFINPTQTTPLYETTRPECTPVGLDATVGLAVRANHKVGDTYHVVVGCDNAKYQPHRLGHPTPTENYKIIPHAHGMYSMSSHAH